MSRKKKIKIIILSSLLIITVIIFIIVLLNIQSSNIQNTDNDYKNVIINYKPSDDAIISQGKLPNNKLIAFIPQITVGKIGDVIETPGGISINVLNVELQDYQDYIALTQQVGFDNVVQSESSPNTIIYSAKRGNSILLRTSYSTDSKKMSLVISKE